MRRAASCVLVLTSAILSCAKPSAAPRPTPDLSCAGAVQLRVDNRSGVDVDILEIRAGSETVVATAPPGIEMLTVTPARGTYYRARLGPASPVAGNVVGAEGSRLTVLFSRTCLPV